MSDGEQSSPQQSDAIEEEKGVGEGEGEETEKGEGEGEGEGGSAQNPSNCDGSHAHEPTRMALIKEYDVEQSA